MNERFSGVASFRRRVAAAIGVAAFSFGSVSCSEAQPINEPRPVSKDVCVYHDDGEHITLSLEEIQRCLGALAVQGKTSETKYDRNKEFGGWRTKDGCSTRETILIRDLTEEVVNPDTCAVISGTFDDIYTAKNENEHVSGAAVSHIEIDHVVALDDAWQSGASDKDYPEEKRKNLTNDPLNLQATSRANNRDKSDKDAHDWTPPRASAVELCTYGVRQVLVKNKYSLWVRSEEHETLKQIFEDDCSKDRAIVVPS